MSSQNAQLALKITESVGLVLGPALFALNLFSFKVTRSGYYYETASEWGIAIGVLLVATAIVARKWQG